jgi:hypothetical protein
MYTSEMLQSNTTKKRLSDREEYFKKLGEDDIVSVRNSSSCISTVISTKDALEIWSSRHNYKAGESLLVDCGFTICGKSLDDNFVDYEYVFVTDDHLYGYPHLEKLGWTKYSFNHLGTCYQDFQTFEEMTDWFYKGAKIIQSEEELLAILNGEN